MAPENEIWNIKNNETNSTALKQIIVNYRLIERFFFNQNCTFIWNRIF